MKICIVTVYNSSNYGSFFQANALQTVLKKYGHEVFFLKNGARNPSKDIMRVIIKKLTKFEFYGYNYQIKKVKTFKKISRKFNECTIDSSKNIKLFIFGSDEIWNVKRKRIRNFPSFFGGEIDKNIKKISYAPSINDATDIDFQNNSKFIELLKTFDQITVRDHYSQEVLSKLIDKNIRVVIDPTMLLDQKYYFKDIVNNHMSDYIAVYSYGHMLTKESIKQLCDYANMNNKKIISLLEYFPWADMNLSLNPNELLGYFSNADFIFTDTFHGSVFSIILNKQFILASKNSPKIEQLLKDFQIEDRNINNRNINEVLNDSIDFIKINTILEQKRKYSLEILDEMINFVMEGIN